VIFSFKILKIFLWRFWIKFKATLCMFSVFGWGSVLAVLGSGFYGQLLCFVLYLYILVPLVPYLWLIQFFCLFKKKNPFISLCTWFVILKKYILKKAVENNFSFCREKNDIFTKMLKKSETNTDKVIFC
jgi:hypothetical protein